ncbi:TetR family transcriptional regulator [Herbihabitans rhizosphaerae]|uniref:TetR family transcriptional regulator n=1 Tax=Herbihabitans rhizosphaerae TaxID=1872711 RepID=A0A4Q7KDV0_9PSEU|nr:TetR/AcrR family transcriptional regulator [Herbihabitans rhizosphaerae]RZS30549.1 TetR family transcriptional regulator [Herbihabitans rhizosphaerae]
MDAGTSPRERYRAQVRAEIKQHAWEQLATTGVAALSLNAIAKQLGMSGPALYRYFASRDELITDLVRDAYRSLADTVRSAFDAGADVAGLAHAIRKWALDDPQRYLLIYGTPVPGYHAPDDTTTISDKVMVVLIDAFAAQPRNGPVSAPASRRALSFWTRVHGVLSLELAGHFAGMDVDPAQLFADEVDTLL